MEEYVRLIWLVIFLFFSLMVLYILSKLLIIRGKMKIIALYAQRIETMYETDSSDES